MIEKKFNYFIILANMRTGSNLLESYLSNFNTVKCFGELFNSKFIGKPNSPPFPDLTIAQRDRKPHALLELMINSAPDKITGFRFFSNHDPEIFDYCLKDPLCAKIILTRNPLESYISFKIAQKTEQWQLKDLARLRSAKAVFNQEEFIKHLENYQTYQDNINKALQSSGQVAFRIDYKDIKNINSINGLGSFLGTSEKLTVLKTQFKKQNFQKIEKKVENPDEMKKSLYQFNIFNTPLIDYFAPDKTENSQRIILSKELPLMYLPLQSPHNDDPIYQQFKNLTDNTDDIHHGLGVSDIRKWCLKNTGYTSLTYVQSPLKRIYDIFCSEICFAVQPNTTLIRRKLIKRFGLTFPKLTKSTFPKWYTITHHKNNFEKFLEFIKGQQAEQSIISVPTHWNSQTRQINEYRPFAVPHYIITPISEEVMFTAIKSHLGIVKPKPPIKDIPDHHFMLSDIYSSKIATLAYEAYKDDYVNFGFTPYY